MTQALPSIFKGTKTWTRRDPALPPSRQHKWNTENPDKVVAHARVRQAQRSGELVRGACEVCGALRTEGHHSDYTMPLAVQWLCRTHHSQLHAKMKRASA